MEGALRGVFCLVVIVCLVAFAWPVMGADDKKDDGDDANFTLAEALKDTPLTDAEKKWLKEREKDLMKQAAEMVTARLDEDSKLLTAICKYTIANVKDWSAFAGQASAGDYAGVMKLAGRDCGKPGSQVCDRQPPGRRDQEQLCSYCVENAVDAGKAAAVAMMNPNKTWPEVGEAFWKEAKSSAKTYLEKQTEELPSTIINTRSGKGSSWGIRKAICTCCLSRRNCRSSKSGMPVTTWASRTNCTQATGQTASGASPMKTPSASCVNSWCSVPTRRPLAGQQQRGCGLRPVREHYRQSPESTRMGEWLRAKLKNVD